MEDARATCGKPVETNEDPSTLSRAIHRQIGQWAFVTVARRNAERLSRRNRSSKIGLRFIPRLSIHPGDMSATNTFNWKRPLGNVLRRLRTMPRLALGAEDGLELGASSFAIIVSPLQALTSTRRLSTGSRAYGCKPSTRRVADSQELNSHPVA